MKRAKILSLVLIVLTLGLFSCQKDNTVNTGPSSLGVKIQAVNKSYSLPVTSDGTKSALATTSTIDWDSAQMVVSTIKFEARLKSLVTHQDSIEISYKWNGPQVTDLMDTTITFGDFVLQPGFYDEMVIYVSGSRKDAGDNPVFYMHGTYTNDSQASVPVMVKVNEDVLFKTTQDSIEVTGESVDFTSYVQLYLDQLLAGISPSAFDNAKLSDGIIVISEESNRDIYRTILRNLMMRHHHCYYKYKYHYWGDHH